MASRKKLQDEYGDIALFRVSPLQPCINGLHKMETAEEKKVNMDSLTNFVKDIAAFRSLISAATSCHDTATALSRRRFFLLM